LKRLNKGTIRILICSDLLARGIDIADVDCVINYDPPKQLLAYVHRAGRTARAGLSGSVVTIADDTEINQFKKLMESNNRWSSFTQLDVSKDRIKELKPKYREALGQLKNDVQLQNRNSKNRRFRKRPKPSKNESTAKKVKVE